jgi:hypothetical protein
MKNKIELKFLFEFEEGAIQSWGINLQVDP